MATVLRLLGSFALVVTIGCAEETIVECEDQYGNPVNCPEAGGHTGSTSQSGGGTSVGADSTDGTDSSVGADGASGVDGGSTTDGTPPPRGQSCDGLCGSWLGESSSCHCDDQCEANGDCCFDFSTLCSATDGVDGTDGIEGSDESDGPPPEYTFPSPFQTDMLSYGDCRGIASGNSSYCDSYDCRGIVKRDKGPCTTNDCKGIASANYSWCDSPQCKGIARGYKCLDEYEQCMDDADGSEAKASCEDTKESCQVEASGYCSGHKACKAIARQDSSWCGSSDGNCKAIVKNDGSFCFYGGDQ